MYMCTDSDGIEEWVRQCFPARGMLPCSGMQGNSEYCLRYNSSRGTFTLVISTLNTLFIFEVKLYVLCVQYVDLNLHGPM